MSSAVATSMVDARTSSIRPDLLCIWVDDFDHRGQCVVVGVDDDVNAVAEDVQLRVGHQHRDFDEQVGLEVQAGHFAVDPHQFVSHSAQQ